MTIPLPSDERGVEGQSPPKVFAASVHTAKTNDASFVNWTCPYRSWRMVNSLTGEVRDFDCKSWRCVVHGPMNAWRWGLRIGGVPWTLMVTFTNVPDDIVKARRGWQNIARYLRRLGVTGFVKAMELGPVNGMRHYHVLLAGVSYLDLEALNALLARAGHGFCYATRVKSKQRAARYILKYPFKDLGAHATRFRGWRVVTASRSIPSWKLVSDRYHKKSSQDLHTEKEEGWELTRPVNRKIYAVNRNA